MNRERSYLRTHESRLKMIDDMLNSDKWGTLCTTESKESTCYIFISRDNSVTITINDGLSERYDDVIVCDN